MLTEGEERLFWSTSALGEGIDASTIRVVIHVGGINKLDDFG
jgi:superfamily II DNA helicase RecQ